MREMAAIEALKSEKSEKEVCVSIAVLEIRFSYQCSANFNN